MANITITFTDAQVIRGESGPDTVVIVGTDETGKTHDFDVQLPRGQGEQYLKDLGFSGWDLTEPGTVQRRSGRLIKGDVRKRIFADGSEPVVLTAQAIGFDGEKAKAVVAADQANVAAVRAAKKGT